MNSRSLPRTTLLLTYLVCLLAGPTLFLRADADWPQFLGPARNGEYTGTNLAQTWPKEGPRKVWQKNIGQGFSGPAVSQGKLILFHRVDNKEVVDCLDASDGQAVWHCDWVAAGSEDRIPPAPLATWQAR